MNTTIRLRVLVLTLLLATSSLLALAGCGDQVDTASAANDPATQSISKYESEITKSKAATPKKAKAAR